MKKAVSFLLSIILVFSFCFSAFSVSEAQHCLTSYKTPTGQAELAFSKRLGAGYANAPSVPTVVGDTLIVAAGKKLYKLNAKNGEEIASASTCSSVGYSVVAPTYAEGKIFVQLYGGVVQAFDYKSMKSLWVYTDPLGGQALCPITYDGGYIYTGFWNGEEKEANYVCLKTSDENPNSQNEAKKAAWTYKNKGGYYRSGSAVNEKSVIFGADNGKDDSTSKSRVVSLDKKTGKLLSSISVSGDVRSSVSYCESTKSYYVSSKGGYVYRFSCNESTGKLTTEKSVKIGDCATATPIASGERLYVGYLKNNEGFFAVLDSKSLKTIYTSKMLGYPQAAALVSTAYAGKRYIYLSYNAKPGGVTMFEDSDGQTAAKKTEIFTPDSALSQFGISPIVCGADGTLYYKNDSGAIMALKEKKASTLWQFEGLKHFILNIYKFLKRVLNK